jgi:hypothetical protein
MASRDEDFGAALTLAEGDDGIWSPSGSAPATETPDWRSLYEQERSRADAAEARAEELRDATLADPFSFTKGLSTLRIPTRVRFGAERGRHADRNQSRLFDLQNDPGQTSPLQDEAIEARMIDHLVRLMAEADAPPEQYRRLGLSQPA